MHSTAVSMSPWPEIIMTGQSGFISVSLLSTSMPSMFGILMSVRTASKSPLVNASMPFAPSSATVTL